MINDLLIQHIRNLAIVAKSTGIVHQTIVDSIQFIEDEFGLSGDIIAKGQRTERKPEAVDTNRNVAVNHTQDDPKKLGDKTYLPAHGVFAFSQSTVYEWARASKLIGCAYSYGDDKQVWAINEQDILVWADIIKANRQLSYATEQLRKDRDINGDVKHPGTDADDSVRGTHGRDYHNWSDVEKSQSSISLTICSGSRYLNGSMSYHQNYINIVVNSPDGRSLVELALSPEQFSSFLIGRTAIPCTLDHYWSMGDGTVGLRERVYEPESILDRMGQRLKDSIGAQDVNLAEIINDLIEKKGKPLSKGALDTLISGLEGVVNRRIDNAAFVIEQAMEEGSRLAETAAIRVLLAQDTGNGEVAASLAKSFSSAKIESKP